MVSISDGIDVERWLTKKPQDVAVIIGVRAALRVAPLIETMLLSMAPRRRKETVAKFGRFFVLPAFRAVAMPWAVVAHGRAIFLVSGSIKASVAAGAHQAAAKAHGNVVHALKGSKTKTTGKHNAAADATSAAAFAISTYVTAKDANPAANAANAVAAAAAAATDTVDNAAAIIYEAVSVDVTELGQGGQRQPADLAIQALWPTGMPHWASEHWTRLKDALLAEDKDWEVWTDWYEARLSGGPIDHGLELARAVIKEEFWKSGPRKVNGEIARLIGMGQMDVPEATVKEERTKAAGATPSPSSNVPQPIDKLPSPVGFGLSSAGKVVVTTSPTNLPVFQRNRNKRDHADRLQACRVLAQDLLSHLNPNNPKYQARSTYRQQLENYADRLPSGPDDGNILLADAAARILRSLFQAEAAELSPELAAELKVMLEHHIGLRAFYPGVEEFYSDVKAGRLETPLPLDAVESVFEGVIKFTPMVFDPTVSREMETATEPEPQLSPGPASSSADANQPQPPPDPIGEVDPNKSHSFRQAGTVNALWKAFLDGEKMNKAIEGWQKAGETLAPHVSKVIEWLHAFLPPSGPSMS